MPPPAAADASTDAGGRYTATAIALHWLIGLAVIGQIAFGRFLQEIPRGAPPRGWYVNLHKSIGVTLGVLIVFRLWWRWAHAPPAAPDWTPQWERTAARASHLGLYACMLIMPATGYVASNFSKWGVKYFNVIMLPPWGVDDRQIYAFFNGAHVATSYVFIVLIAVHVLGALRHLMLRDGIFQRIWPPRRQTARGVCEPRCDRRGGNEM